MRRVGLFLAGGGIDFGEVERGGLILVPLSLAQVHGEATKWPRDYNNRDYLMGNVSQ